jgi:hypothetical protein
MRFQVRSNLLRWPFKLSYLAGRQLDVQVRVRDARGCSLQANVRHLPGSLPKVVDIILKKRNQVQSYSHM